MKTHIVLAALLLCGCYEYTALTPSAETPGKAVRVELTDAGTNHVASLLGPGADYVDGDLASLTDSAYTISISALRRRSGVEESWKGESVTVSRSDVRSIALRKPSPRRSVGLTALLTGGAFLIAHAISGNEGTVVTKPGGTPGGQ